MQKPPIVIGPRSQPPQQRPPATKPPIVIGARREPPSQHPPVKRPPIVVGPRTQPPRSQQPPIIRKYKAPIRMPQMIRNEDQRRFTRTRLGRVYDNGLSLRRGKRVSSAWERRYFRTGFFHFPYYRSTYIRTQTCISPFGFYYGVCAPFISSAYCRSYPPNVVFIDVPIYNGNVCEGFDNSGNQNFLDDANLEQVEPGLVNALGELTEAFQGGNIDALVPLIDPNTMIAIYERGRYQYSLSGNDYLDITRDAIEQTRTVQFSIDNLHQVAPGVFSASGRHIYRDAYGQEQTMYVSFVLQDISGQWTLTQVGTAPGRYRNIVSGAY